MASIEVDAAEVAEVTNQSDESALKSPPAYENTESQHDFLDEEESEDVVVLPDEIGKDQEKPNDNHFDDEDEEDDKEDQELNKPRMTTQIEDEDKENIYPSTMSAGGTASEYSEEEEDADD